MRVNSRNAPAEILIHIEYLNLKKNLYTARAMSKSSLTHQSIIDKRDYVRSNDRLMINCSYTQYM